MTTTNADDDLHDDMVWASSSRDGDGISRDDDDARARVMRAPCILDDGVRLVVDDGDTVRARARVVAIARHPSASASAVRRSVGQSLGRRDWIKRAGGGRAAARVVRWRGRGGGCGMVVIVIVVVVVCGFVDSCFRRRGMRRGGWRLTRKARAASIG